MNAWMCFRLKDCTFISNTDGTWFALCFLVKNVMKFLKGLLFGLFGMIIFIRNKDLKNLGSTNFIVLRKEA